MSTANSIKIRETLVEVENALVEKGYKASDQICGYLISGDPTYISSYKGAREKIMQFERSEIISEVLNFFFEKEESIYF